MCEEIKKGEEKEKEQETIKGKKQIWFTDKDDDFAHLYCLNSFKSQEGVRQRSDLKAKYNKGHFNALPSPDLYQILEDLIYDK